MTFLVGSLFHCCLWHICPKQPLGLPCTQCHTWKIKLSQQTFVIDTMPPPTFASCQYCLALMATICSLFQLATFAFYFLGCWHPLLGHIPRLQFVLHTHTNMVSPYSIHSPISLSICNKCQKIIKVKWSWRKNWVLIEKSRGGL